MDRDFKDFVASSLRELSHFGLLLAGNQHDGADLLQEALERTLRRWRRVNLSGNPVGYVKRAMVNAHISRWRRLRRELLTNEIDHLALAAPEVQGSDCESRLWVGLLRLPPRQRAVVVLRYYEGLSEAEIAYTLNCAPGTVKSQCSKALASLRRYIEDQQLTDDTRAATP